MAGKQTGMKSTESIDRRELAVSEAPLHSAVKWALLGLLIERPDHGYELARRFEAAYGEALGLSEASYVYRALDSLQRRGLIEALPDQAPARPQRTSYCVTEHGISSYQEHLIEQVQRFNAAAQVHLRKLAVFTGQPQCALEVIERMEELCASDPLDPYSADRSERDRPGALAHRLHAPACAIVRSAMLEWLQIARGEVEAL
jgi:DNA-binding PadR family transcriptional regulator